MKRTIYHITPRKTENGLEWAVKKEKSERASSVVENKQDAIDIARKLISDKPGQIKIHSKTNEIQKEYTYRNDPEISKG
jgi:hypothetical protein